MRTIVEKALGLVMMFAFFAAIAGCAYLVKWAATGEKPQRYECVYRTHKEFGCEDYDPGRKIP
jgi:hypothetical protein